MSFKTVKNNPNSMFICCNIVILTYQMTNKVHVYKATYAHSVNEFCDWFVIKIRRVVIRVNIYGICFGKLLKF